MRASWGYDQTTFPKEPSISNPGGRVSGVEEHNDERDPTIPDGLSMSEEALTKQMRLMKKYAVEKELNMTHTFQVSRVFMPPPPSSPSSCLPRLRFCASRLELRAPPSPQGSAGKANGIISKPRFKTALGMLFHQFPLTEELIAAISFKYGCGPPDPHGGGYMEVMWRAFVIELRQYEDPDLPPPPNYQDERIAMAMSEMRQIAEDSGLDMTHSMQGAGGRSTGVIAKQKFFMAMTSLLFPHYHFTSDLLNDIALCYANTKGPPDLRLGGFQEVLWRQFVIDLRKCPLPEMPLNLH